MSRSPHNTYEYVILHSIADEPSEKIENAFYHMKIIDFEALVEQFLSRVLVGSNYGDLVLHSRKKRDPLLLWILLLPVNKMWIGQR
jgi:hypothetical protein